MSLPDTQHGRCRLLWMSVLHDALTHGSTDSLLDWLMSAVRREVCALAGVDLDWAAERFVEAGGVVEGYRGRGKSVTGRGRQDDESLAA